MEKTKLLTWAVIALFLLNLGTLGFLFVSGPKGHREPGQRPEGPKNLIIEKLHFDIEQIKKYEKLIQWHRANISATEDQIRDSKNALYLHLKQNPIDEKAKDSIINVLASYQKQIETIHFKHFQDIKALCTKEQLDNFNSLTEELARLFSKPLHRR